MRRYYLTSVVGSGTPGVDPRRPKHFVGENRMPLIEARELSMLGYGRSPVMLVVAETTDEEHAAISAQPDVWAHPIDLDQPIGSDLPAIRAHLEAVHIPAHWLDASHSHKTLLQWLTKLFAVHQRYEWLTAATFADAGLDVPYGDLDGERFHVMRATARTLGLAWPENVTPMKLRHVLKHLADQLRHSKMAGELE